MLSASINILTSGADRWGALEVINDIPNPIVKAPIPNIKTVSWSVSSKLFLVKMTMNKTKIQQRNPPRKVPPRTSVFLFFLI